MAQTRINPTRMELKKLQEKYRTARRGHKLLKDKRDELMRQFLDIVREDKEIRAKVEKKLAGVYGSFSVASALSNKKMLEEALIYPKKEAELGVEYRNLMSVNVPSFSMKLVGNGEGGISYGYAFTSGELDSSLSALSDVLEDLLKMAELEKTAQLLSAEIERTRRRVNALEYILIPDYLSSIKTIKMKLEENDRGNITRLMKVKDMMLEAQRSRADNQDGETDEYIEE